MAPPLGNKYWLRRNPNTGHRPRKFDDPEVLWTAACEYFEWAEANPLIVEHPMGTKDGPEIVRLNKARPLTMKGLCLHIDLSWDAFSAYRKRDDFKETCQRIDDVIFTQKFEGAAVGIFNHNLITRDLGLKEQSEISGPGGGPIRVTHEDALKELE